MRLRELAVCRMICPCCGCTWLIRLKRSEMGVRCLKCRATTVHMSMAQVIKVRVDDLKTLRVHEFSSAGSFVSFLRRSAGSLTLSEYFDDVPSGESRDGVRCENVESLSFGDKQFDLVTCTEVFEHVGDDRRGFSEVLRVLKFGGHFIFTVPLRTDRTATVERAVRTSDGSILHHLPPEYHNDQLRGAGRVLSFRDYALDLPARLMDAGFQEAEIVYLDKSLWWGFSRAVIVARKSNTPLPVVSTHAAHSSVSA